ncbi:hypothetical protein [Flammeovirga sp. SJP92]|uniref:hypothetical protein n=1 Tax=Flammeovirga sp. SJP92 TaxID=1775430 RepID=UPI0007893F85|nr:hypothetical protein [Flammeovirga sp. SJP92]KXX71267.1 hypothetical protein AVL50_09425 [Flammeovirga sp. SJP92]
MNSYRYYPFKRIVLLLLFFFYISCSTKTGVYWDDLTLRGNIKQIIIEKKSIGEDGLPPSITIKNYDRNRNIVNEHNIIISGKDTIIHKTIYSYKNGLVSQVNVDNFFLMFYDKHNNLGLPTGGRIFENVSDEVFIQNRFVFTYNDKVKTKIMHFSISDSLVFEANYFYRDEELYEKVLGENIIKYYDYVYDKFGNWIERCEEKTMKTKITRNIEQRKIEYY